MNQVFVEIPNIVHSHKKFLHVVLFADACGNKPSGFRALIVVTNKWTILHAGFYIKVTEIKNELRIT